MLRASSEIEGQRANLEAVVEGESSGLPGGDALLAFAQAGLGDDAAVIAQARDGVVEALGEPAMVDAAGVVANFQRMVRIADSTGIPLDEPVLMMTQGIRADLGINDYSGQDNSPELKPSKKLLGKVLAPFTATMFKRLAARRVGKH